MIIVYTVQLPPFIMVPFSVGLGPQRGCQIAPPIKYLKCSSHIHIYIILKKYSRYKLNFLIFKVQTIYYKVLILKYLSYEYI